MSTRSSRTFAALRDESVDADTIFFGGGTPSLLEPGEVARIIQACRDSFDLSPDSEITLEANPESSTGTRLTVFARRESID